jgi:hypothetical protein
MKETQSTIALFLGGFALLLTIIVVGFGLSNRGLEHKLQGQQGTINKGQLSQQVGSALIRDAATIAVNQSNSQLRELLSKHGISININNNK